MPDYMQDHLSGTTGIRHVRCSLDAVEQLLMQGTKRTRSMGRMVEGGFIAHV